MWAEKAGDSSRSPKAHSQTSAGPSITPANDGRLKARADRCHSGCNESARASYTGLSVNPRNALYARHWLWPCRHVLELARGADPLAQLAQREAAADHTHAAVICGHFHSTVTAIKNGADLVMVDTKSRLWIGTSGRGLIQVS